MQKLVILAAALVALCTATFSAQANFMVDPYNPLFYSIGPGTNLGGSLDPLPAPFSWSFPIEAVVLAIGILVLVAKYYFDRRTDS